MLTHSTNKYLIAFPSPRDIPEVQDEVASWKHDIFMVKYHQQKKAYRLIKDYFMKHLEYTHLIIVADDLVVPAEKMEELISIIEANDFPVLTGLCAVDEDETRPNGIPLAIQWKVMQEQNAQQWVWMHEIEDQDNVFTAEHTGLPCGIIKRNVFETVSWRGATKTDNSLEGNYDWQFSLDCKKLNIPIHVCKSVYLQHLRNRQKKQAKANPKCKKGFTKVRKDGSWN